MKDESSAILLLNLKIESYNNAILMCLEYIADEKPQGCDLMIVSEQRILYTKFRDELTGMRDSLK